MNNKTSYPFLFIIVITGIISAALITGCEEQLLNQEPRGELSSPNFFETAEHAIQATNATYEMLRDFNIHSFPWIGMTDIASDDADKGSTPADNPEMLAIDNFTFDASNGLFLGPWNAYYEGIFRANLAINNIPDIEEMDEGLRDRLIGENQFLRAYYYFFLIRAYGGPPGLENNRGVPLVLENMEVGDDFDMPRASIEEIYVQIEEDLENAIDVLPLKSEYDASDLGRATQGAAQALLAKVHLFQDEFEDAELRAREVIDSGEYSLFPDYDGIFTQEGENSSESVFEVQAVALESQLGGTQYSEVQGVRGVPNLGWGFNGPTQDLLAAYEAGDPRLGPTVLFVHEILPSEEDVVHDNPGMFDERYNQKSFIPISTPGGNFNGGSNIRRIRYSDVLLIAAESAYRNGNEGDARDFVNQVRERARDGRTATLGLHVEAFSDLLADTLGLGSELPATFIRLVAEGSAGEDGGLQSFDFELVEDGSVILVNNIDIIQSVDGTDITSPEEFYSEMETKSVGEPVTLNILRASQTYDGQLSTTTENVVVAATTEELLPDITASGQELLDAIWHERRVELAMEQHRFFDIVRQGRAGELLREHGKDFEDGTHERYPIPQDEVDLSGLEQNTGY